MVDDVTVHLQQGEVVGLLGQNGAGKTTTFYMIVGLITPDSGRILLNEEDITGLPMYQRARKGISYLSRSSCCRSDSNISSQQASQYHGV